MVLKMKYTYCMDSAISMIYAIAGGCISNCRRLVGTCLPVRQAPTGAACRGGVLTAHMKQSDATI